MAILVQIIDGQVEVVVTPETEVAPPPAPQPTLLEQPSPDVG